MAAIDLQLSDADVQRIADAVAAKVIAALPPTAPTEAALISEPAAAAMLDVAPHVLRDARKRGRIRAHRIGRFVRYSREEIADFKARTLEDK